MICWGWGCWNRVFYLADILLYLYSSILHIPAQNRSMRMQVWYKYASTTINIVSPVESFRLDLPGPHHHHAPPQAPDKLRPWPKLFAVSILVFAAISCSTTVVQPLRAASWSAVSPHVAWPYEDHQKFDVRKPRVFSDDLTLSLFFNENDKRYWWLIPQPFLHCSDVEQNKIIWQVCFYALHHVKHVKVDKKKCPIALYSFLIAIIHTGNKNSDCTSRFISTLGCFMLFYCVVFLAWKNRRIEDIIHYQLLYYYYHPIGIIRFLGQTDLKKNKNLPAGAAAIAALPIHRGARLQQQLDRIRVAAACRIGQRSPTSQKPTSHADVVGKICLSFWNQFS